MKSQRLEYRVKGVQGQEMFIRVDAYNVNTGFPKVFKEVRRKWPQLEIAQITCLDAAPRAPFSHCSLGMR